MFLIGDTGEMIVIIINSNIFDSKPIKLFTADFCIAYSTAEISRRKNCNMIPKKIYCTTFSISFWGIISEDTLNTSFQLIY
ncbi:hypothetical protein SDC9_183581 [bioreactor metagenome]|uniref:Uncharacterized protein n=1 Tax=bioreactor metagenome TaxID=1076179 RepID=A0A645HC31_9ZZZZ